MHQQTKNITFKEESSKCNLHQEVNRFICKCSQKFCSKCLTQNKDLNSHFKIHSDYKLYHIKDCKSYYLNQVEEIENIVKEIYEGGNEENSMKEKDRKKLPIENFALRELKSNLMNLINFKVDKYFESLFKQEEKVLEEMIKISNSNDLVLDSDGVINSIEKLIKLKKNGKLSAISTFEKMNSVQNSFLGKIDKLLEEFEILMKKYFGKDSHYDFHNEDFDSQVKIDLEEKIEIQPNIEPKNKSLGSKANEIPTNAKEINKYSIECESPPHKLISKENKLSKTLVFNLNLNISSSSHKDFKLYNLEDISDSHNSKISVLNNIANFAEEANIYTNSCFKNIHSNSLWKDGIIPEISGSIEDISYCMKSNQIKKKDLSNSSLDLDKKSFITEFNINKENRNRINKIIFYKKQRRTENLYRSPKKYGKKKYVANHFQRIPDQTTPTNFNNFNPAYGFPTKGFTLMPNVNALEIQNSLGDDCLVEPDKYPGNNIQNGTNRLCVDCYTPYSSKNANTWKKRCATCQKTFYEKITNIKNFYSVNSYKAGKMNQTCLKCKNSFIVPVALAKQRKTCYYCFKSIINN